MYVYGFSNPDKDECWIGYPEILGVRSNEKSVSASSEFMSGAVNYSDKLRLWCKMGFFLFCVHLVMLLLERIGTIISSKGMAGCGVCANCCAILFGMGWGIWGSYLRWNKDGF